MKSLKNDIQMFATVFYEYIGSPLIESVKVTIKCPAKLGTTIPSGWTKEDDYTLTRVYTEDSTQLVTLYLYPGSSSGSVINVDVNINVFGIGKINTHDQKFYAFGENKSKQEVYTKSEVYSKAEFAILRGEFTEVGNKYVDVRLFFPDETWTQKNTMIISCRVTHFDYKSDGTMEQNQSECIPSTVFMNSASVSTGLMRNYSVFMTPNGQDRQGTPCDIYITGYLVTGLKSGDKQVFEVLIMKIDSEVEE